MTTIRPKTDDTPPETVRVYTDAQLMENRRKFILSIWAHRSRAFVRKDRIIPRKKNLKPASDQGEQNDSLSSEQSDCSYENTAWSGSTNDLDRSFSKDTGMYM
jgi:hypothetical protein